MQVPWTLKDDYWCMIKDVKRTRGFLEAIERVVSPDDVVLELGVGPYAIFSMFAAKKGAFVYAIDYNEAVLRECSEHIRRNNLQERVKVLKADLLRDDLEHLVETRASVAICEMLFTGLLDEPQVAVMNRAWRYLLEPNATVIPRSAKIFGKLVNLSFSYFGFDLPTNIFIKGYSDFGEEERLVESNALTDWQLLEHIDFTRPDNTLNLDKKCLFSPTRSGTANALVIATEVELIDGLWISKSDDFLPWVVYPLKNPVNLKKVHDYALHIKYHLGSGYDSLLWEKPYVSVLGSMLECSSQVNKDSTTEQFALPFTYSR